MWLKLCGRSILDTPHVFCKMLQNLVGKIEIKYLVSSPIVSVVKWKEPQHQEIAACLFSAGIYFGDHKT